MVFLSYARKDGRDAALRLKSELESNRLVVWMDAERIEGGADARDRMETNLHGVYAADDCAEAMLPKAGAKRKWRNSANRPAYR